MAKFCFTGNPFVDAGLAGMCAAAKVDSLSDLDEQAVDRAAAELKRVMGSDAMFQKRRVTSTKESAFATSEMSVVFPNGPFSNPAVKGDENKKKQYRTRFDKKHEGFRQLVAGQSTTSGYGSCFVDGSAAFARVGNDEFPLVDSKAKRNFHPGLQGGHAIGAVTALALEFFPLSVLRTGVNTGFFWFVHTAVEKIAIACARMTLDAMNRAMARHEGLGFFGDWAIPSRDADAALVALIRDLMGGRNQSAGALSWKEIEAGRYPITAYVFSNDNRGPSIVSHDLPHELFWFFNVLHPREVAFGRFNREVIARDSFGYRVPGRAQSIAQLILLSKPIISRCVSRPTEERSGELRGGWEAHAWYATEVLKVSSAFIRDIEAVSGCIVGHEKEKDFVLALQRKGEANAALLRLARNELVTFDEFACLVPPEKRYGAATARDYLLAAIYERQSAAANDQAFVPWPDDEDRADEPNEGKHSLVQLTERIGAKLVADSDLGRHILSDLARPKGPADLRGAVLRLVKRGLVSWAEFVDIFPLDLEKRHVSYVLRDYLLAYLYWNLRDPNLPEAEPLDENAPDDEENKP